MITYALSHTPNNTSHFTFSMPNITFLDQLRKSLEDNTKFQSLLSLIQQDPMAQPYYSVHGGIPQDCNRGHMGVAKTLHRLQENFFWPNMCKDFQTYVAQCLVNKSSMRPNDPQVLSNPFQSHMLFGRTSPQISSPTSLLLEGIIPSWWQFIASPREYILDYFALITPPTKLPCCSLTLPIKLMTYLTVQCLIVTLSSQLILALVVSCLWHQTLHEYIVPP